MHVAHFCTRQMFWRKLTMQILKGGILCRSRARARVDKVAPLPVAFLLRIVLIKKRGTPVMKNPSDRSGGSYGIAYLDSVLFDCDTGRRSRYYARNIYWRYYERAFALKRGIKRLPLRFSVLILLAILRYTTMLQYQSCFSSSHRWFFFWNAQ